MTVGILADGKKTLIVHLSYREDEVIVSLTGEAHSRSVEKIACTPSRKMLATCPGTVLPCIRTTNKKTVTCPLCKLTERYLDLTR